MPSPFHPMNLKTIEENKMMNFNLDNKSSQKTGKVERHVKVLILGSGPAGLSAALYAARAELAPVVLAGDFPGGQVSLTFDIENYPGYPEGVSGADLVQNFQKQAERFGAVIEYETALSVDLSKRPFQIDTYGTQYLADTLIIATGASSTHLDVPGEREFTGRGVSYCATCDGYFFKNKNVIVVGGGDSAVEEGIFLTRFASSVTVVHRRDTLRAGPILQQRAFENPKMHFIWDTILTEITGDEVVKAVKTRNIKTGEEGNLPIDGVFVFIGHMPNTEIFNGQLDMDQNGYIRTDHLLQTSVPGVFAAGEAADPIYRQVITSAGMGAAAAIRVNHYLGEVLQRPVAMEPQGQP
jgi:thioredoxin reductase (NADPH)